MLAREAIDHRPASDEWDLIRIDMLTEQECTEVCSAVHDLMGFKSRARLGAAIYKSLPLVGKQINHLMYQESHYPGTAYVALANSLKMLH